MRSLIVHPRRGCCSRDPITWLAAVVLPAAVLLIFGQLLRQGRSRPGAWRSSLDRAVRALPVDRHQPRHAGHPDAAHPPCHVPEKGRAAAAFHHAGRPALPAGSTALHLRCDVDPSVSLALLIAGGEHGVRHPRCRATSLGYVAAFLVGMTAMFAIGLLVAAVAPSARAATAVAVPNVLHGHVPRRRLSAAGAPARPAGADRRFHAARRPGSPRCVAGWRRHSCSRSVGMVLLSSCWSAVLARPPLPLAVREFDRRLGARVGPASNRWSSVRPQ